MRRKDDMFLLPERTSIQLAHAGLVPKTSNQVVTLTGSNERDGKMSMSCSPSSSSVLTEDTVIVGDKMSEAIS